MTSLYIGLKGSYAYKLSYKRWDNLQAYPSRKLYLNVLAESKDNDLTYVRKNRDDLMFEKEYNLNTRLLEIDGR